VWISEQAKHNSTIACQRTIAQNTDAAYQKGELAGAVAGHKARPGCCAQEIALVRCRIGVISESVSGIRVEAQVAVAGGQDRVLGEPGMSCLADQVYGVVIAEQRDIGAWLPWNVRLVTKGHDSAWMISG
jgi:hypothetical protein